MKNNLVKRAFLNAFGVAAYVVLFAWFISNIEQWFGAGEENWLGPAFFLLIFVISASVTGSLVLLKPILLYVEGHKKDAVHLFVYTIGFLVILALVIGFLVLSV